ncbi:uncharacterized protein LOC62_04G005294 [Vanrija pseudolonga]|uniref:Uncharacterized protein n=1 Tax=Vanrija pseudolonga TaxID=143232 RepID=A0AAF0YE01_9TREE|nr:hypothetical protein LOC62_04G005294 [Vanrija pseudolonga]
MAIIDHSSFPTIIDDIFDYTDRGTKLTFSATCHQYRRKVNHAALHHVSWLFFFTTPSCTRGMEFIPQVVKVLDLGGTTLTYATRRCLTLVQRDRFRALETIRRAPPTVPPNLVVKKNHYRLPDVRTVVDYIDLDDVRDWHWRGINLQSCREQHILHLRWEEGKTPAFPEHHFAHFPSRHIKCTVVLWPTPYTPWPPTATGSAAPIHSYIEHLYHRVIGHSLTIVAPASVPIGINLTATNIPIVYVAYDDWCETLGHEKDVLSEWIRWPDYCEFHRRSVSVDQEN